LRVSIFVLIIEVMGVSSNSLITFLRCDHLSSQVNRFEADTVASLLWLLEGSLADKLDYERQPDGRIRPILACMYGSPSFKMRP
jgi:hypothetical protein